MFTRRIADPQFGVRLTGKVGRYAIGALAVDDQAPGKLPAVPEVAGKRAYLGVLRVSRDIFGASSLGFIVTDLEFGRSYNRVGGVDGRLRFGRKWSTSFQAVGSSTLGLDGSYRAGPAYDLTVRRTGRQFNYGLDYRDRSPGFRTAPGFLQRADVREIRNVAYYQFRPEGKTLVAWGPQFESYDAWDHAGNRINWMYAAALVAELKGQTWFALEYAPEFEMLRPVDFPGLSRNRGYRRHTTIVRAESSYFRKLSFVTEVRHGLRLNIVPPAGQEPELADRTTVDFTATLRPITPLRIDATYLLLRLADRAAGGTIFNDHVARAKCNWQFSRELSLRVILQYEGLLANPARTVLETRKNFNADFLVAYLVHPGTAVYAGYNSNHQNVDLVQRPEGPEIMRTNRFLNDSRGFFVKASYLFRF